ncbi:MAG: UDP-N-acetylmuramate [Geobacteraceae bacterium]|nr:MAG: UDP-N-acetylmuramate [Geobacteraceae bacterium]
MLLDEPLSQHTSLKVGGTADCFVTPADVDDLQLLMALLDQNGASYLVIGGGYNLLVRDGGFCGVVISLRRLQRLEELSGSRVRVEAGVSNGALVRFTEEKSLAGLEFLCGIPGTVGGALAVNAGAHGEAVLEKVETLTTLKDGGVTVRRREELNFGYRHLTLAPGEIILTADFLLAAGDRREMEGRIEAFLAHRHSAQRVRYPNAGSFFKNPPGKQAWRLIDEAGLRGYRIGGAQVAEAHANFLVNRGRATAGDFIELAGLIKAKVRERTGITLEEEVRIVGEDRDQGSGNRDRQNQ